MNDGLPAVLCNCNIYYKFPFYVTILGSFPTINTIHAPQIYTHHLVFYHSLITCSFLSLHLSLFLSLHTYVQLLSLRPPPFTISLIELLKQSHLSPPYSSYINHGPLELQKQHPQQPPPPSPLQLCSCRYKRWSQPSPPPPLSLTSQKLLNLLLEVPYNTQKESIIKEEEEDEQKERT